jgi:hypothetical protein
MESEKRLKELADKLKNKDKNVVNSAILSLRNDDPFTGAIRLLTEEFDKTDDIGLKDLIRNFMNDIKESFARVEVIGEIKKDYKAETIGMLVSSCWQSGLDYSEFAPDLLRVFLIGDYLVSLECLTVIEECAHNISRKTKNEMLADLEQSTGKKFKEKSALIDELRSILT